MPLVRSLATLRPLVVLASVLCSLGGCGSVPETPSEISRPEGAVPPAIPGDPDPEEIQALVGRLDLDRYKATIRDLTRFGDRRAGTARNRDAVDWIEDRLRGYGCADVERLSYEVPLPPELRRREPGGGGRPRGNRARTSVNSDPGAQPDPELRALNSGPVLEGPHEEVYCTKIGATRPDEMYILGAHMDGIGYGEAANDDGSGTAVVLELARILNDPDVRTETSIRFILFNDEESGLFGSQAYVAGREALQGIEDPPGSGRYPEPRWLGMIQHDMMLFDHGMPRADGTLGPAQRPEADVNIEFSSRSPLVGEAQGLAWAFAAANERYANDYPATLGSHMSSTDSESFHFQVPAISVRENERSTQIGAGWDPHWHQPTDVFATFSDADFRLGLDAAQTTLGAVGLLSGVTLVE